MAATEMRRDDLEKSTSVDSELAMILGVGIVVSVVNVVDLALDGGGRAVGVRRAPVILALQARLDNLIGPCQELSSRLLLTPGAALWSRWSPSTRTRRHSQGFCSTSLCVLDGQSDFELADMRARRWRTCSPRL